MLYSLNMFTEHLLYTQAFFVDSEDRERNNLCLPGTYPLVRGGFLVTNHFPSHIILHMSVLQ